MSRKKPKTPESFWLRVMAQSDGSRQASLQHHPCIHASIHSNNKSRSSDLRSAYYSQDPV